MGLSYWFDCMGGQKPGAKYGTLCNPRPSDPFQPVPVPLLANYTPIAQPAGLYTLAKRYAAAAVEFITSSAEAGEPFLLYFPLQVHKHPPQPFITYCHRFRL
jgi:arylsulfatase A